MAKAKDDPKVRGFEDICPDAVLGEWGLTLTAARPARKNAQIFDVRMADGKPAILKLYRDPSMGHEAEAPKFLAAMEGQGCVELYRHGPGALLLEHLGGEMLSRLTKRGLDEAATEVIIETAEAIRGRSMRATSSVDIATRFGSQLSIDPNSHACLQQDSFQQAKAISRIVFARNAEAVRGLLHGDLHHSNIVKGNRGWRAIDPNCMFGQPEAEYAQAFCSPPFKIDLVSDPQRAIGMARRIEAITGMNPAHLLGWGVTKAAQKLALKAKFTPDDTLRIGRTEKILPALIEAYRAVGGT